MVGIIETSGRITQDFPDALKELNAAGHELKESSMFLRIFPRHRHVHRRPSALLHCTSTLGEAKTLKGEALALYRGMEKKFEEWEG